MSFVGLIGSDPLNPDVEALLTQTSPSQRRRWPLDLVSNGDDHGSGRVVRLGFYLTNPRPVAIAPRLRQVDL